MALLSLPLSLTAAAAEVWGVGGDMEGKTPGMEEERLERGSSGPQVEPFDADDDDGETMAAELERYSSASECVRTDTAAHVYRTVRWS